MIKKLIRYGNSNAIVLDKAILELLNIPEGSFVKLKTDGQSLIISKLSIDELNTDQKYLSAIKDVAENNQEPYFEEAEQKKYSSYYWRLLINTLHEIQKKYQLQRNVDEIKNEFYTAAKKLIGIFQLEERNSKEYLKEFNKLRQKFLLPEFPCIDPEISPISHKIYGARRLESL